MHRFQFTFLMYPCEEDKEKSVAHCLELDIVAVGDTVPEAIELLKELVEDTLEAAIAKGSLPKVFHPAPLKYWHIYAQAQPYNPPRHIVRRHIHSRSVHRVSYALAGAS